MLPAALAAARFALPLIAGMAPSVIDSAMTASANAKKQEGEDPEEGHPILAAALGMGLGALTHRGLSAFPRKGSATTAETKGAPPPTNDPAKATPAASQPVAERGFQLQGDVYPARRQSGGFMPMSESELAQRETAQATKEQLARGERGLITTGGRPGIDAEEVSEFSRGMPHNAAEESAESMGNVTFGPTRITSPFPQSKAIEYNRPIGLPYDKARAERDAAQKTYEDAVWRNSLPGDEADRAARELAFAQHEEQLRKAKDHARELAYRLHGKLNQPFTDYARSDAYPQFMG